MSREEGPQEREYEVTRKYHVRFGDGDLTRLTPDQVNDLVINATDAADGGNNYGKLYYVKNLYGYEHQIGIVDDGEMGMHSKEDILGWVDYECSDYYDVQIRTREPKTTTREE